MSLYFDITKQAISIENLNKYSHINTIIADSCIYNGIVRETLDIETIVKYTIVINDISEQFSQFFLVLPSNCENDTMKHFLGLLNNTNIEFILYDWEPTYNIYLELIKKYNNRSTAWVCSNSIYELDVSTVKNISIGQPNSIISMSTENKHLLVLFNIDNFCERLTQLLTTNINTSVEEINYILYLSGFSFFYNNTIKPYFFSITDSTKPISHSYSNKIKFINSDISNNLNEIQKNNLLDITNNSLYRYIEKKLASQENFIIPRISLGIQPQCILLAHNLLEAYKTEDSAILEQYSEQIQHYIPTLKVNSGIYCTDIDSLLQYYSSYMASMAIADYIIEPEVNINSEIYRTIYESVEFIKKENSTKQYNFFYCLEIYNLINKTELWLNLLKNKKILIVSIHSELVEKQIGTSIYKSPLFDSSNCSYLTIKDTRENLESSDWMVEYKAICDKLSDISSNYDIALVAANGFSNPILEYIYSNGKSGIYVGNILDIYFGIIDKKDNSKYMDIMGVFGSNEWIEY